MGNKGKSNHAQNAPGKKAAAGKPGGSSVNKKPVDTMRSSDTMAAKSVTTAKKSNVSKPAAAGKAKKQADPVIATKETASAGVIAEQTGAEQAVLSAEQVQGSPVRLKIEHDGLLPISFVGGLLGMLVGILPATIWMIIFGSVFYPLFMLIPVFIYGGITLFRGCRDIRAVVLTGFLSLVGAYLTSVACEAAAYVAKYNMSAVNIPLVVADLIGKQEALADPFFSSANILPIVFTVIGFLVARLFFKHNDTDTTDEPVSENEHPAADGQDGKLEKAK